MLKIFWRAAWPGAAALAVVASIPASAVAQQAVVVVNDPRQPLPVAVQGTARPAEEPYLRYFFQGVVGGVGEYCQPLPVPAGKRLNLRHVSGQVHYDGVARPLVFVKATIQFPGSTRYARTFLQVTDLDAGTALGPARWAAQLDLLGFQGAPQADGSTLTEWRVCAAKRSGEDRVDFEGFASGGLVPVN